MKSAKSLLLSIVLISCGTSVTDKPDALDSGQIVSSKNSLSNISLAKDTANDAWVTYFIVAADTSSDYYTLHKKMF